MSINLQEIFQNPTHLHLLIWNRFDPVAHEAGLKFTNELLQDEFQGLVMPLIRPLGKGNRDSYIDYRENRFRDHCGDDIPSFEMVYIGSDSKGEQYRTSHCEIWLQASQTINSKLEEKLKEYVTNNRSCFVFIDKNVSPIWQPLGDNLTECDSYAGSLVAFNALEELQKAMLLKLIWLHSSVKLFDQCLANGTFHQISLVDQKLHVRLMESILEDLNLKDFNLAPNDEKIDPSRMGVSHMSLFAINAFTTIEQINKRKTCQIEFAYRLNGLPNGLVTRPSVNFFKSKADFINYMQQQQPHI